MTEENPIPIPVTPNNIWKWVSTQLMEDSDVAALVGQKVFPYTTKDPQKIPWIVVDNIGITYDEDKDDNEPYEATCTVICATKTYTALNTLSDSVVAAVNEKDGCRVKERHQSYVDEIGYIEEVSLTIDLY